MDGDGDLDLAMIGFYVVYNVSAVDMLVVLLNDGPDASGNWTFIHQQVALGGAGVDQKSLSGSSRAHSACAAKPLTATSDRSQPRGDGAVRSFRMPTRG